MSSLSDYVRSEREEWEEEKCKEVEGREEDERKEGRWSTVGS
jgi:hypothetical protein